MVALYHNLREKQKDSPSSRTESLRGATLVAGWKLEAGYWLLHATGQRATLRL